jgi:hypothetical protein
MVVAANTIDYNDEVIDSSDGIWGMNDPAL